MQLQIITPEKILFSADADMINIPGTEGDFGVLPGHAPFISTIRPGIILIDTAQGQRKIALMGGIAETVPDRCTILAEGAEDCAVLSHADAQARLERAKSELAACETPAQRHESEKKLQLAEALLLAL